MDPFKIVECKKAAGCQLGAGHRDLCGERHIITGVELNAILAAWREGKTPDKFTEPREFAS